MHRGYLTNVFNPLPDRRQSAYALDFAPDGSFRAEAVPRRQI
jgi:hypothetical protein